MKNKFLKIGLLVALAAVVVLYAFMFVVNETQQVVVTEFGKPVGEAITEPGIYFKVPFIQKANFFDKRFLEWDGDQAEVQTQEKQSIFVDTYARWQITDPLQFFKRLTNERGAQSRIDDILDGETKDHIAKNNIRDLVRSTNREAVQSELMEGEIQDSLVMIEVGRAQIQDDILSSANLQAADLGIVILDFRFKRINYVQDVKDQVYERMKSERYRIADKFRSEGQGEASRINGEKERELKTIQSEAFRTAEEIKGKADAEAAAIYASAYGKSSMAKDLYGFLKSMETFEKTFDGQTSVILSTDSDLFKYLKEMK
ncbi:MAG: membrane protease subunit HflC [Flavobacteriales bacterium]|jgi:membrane protease subunit HflC